jgi:hypothetical protein
MKHILESAKRRDLINRTQQLLVQLQATDGKLDMQPAFDCLIKASRQVDELPVRESVYSGGVL